MASEDQPSTYTLTPFGNVLISETQILVGQANGQVSCLYSPEHSLNGAKLLANKTHIKKATVESMSTSVLQPQIITPHALPMFRDGEDARSTKRKREKERLDPRKSKRPELPITGPGKGGRVGASATQHVVQNLFRDTTRDQDVSFLINASDEREKTLVFHKTGVSIPAFGAASCCDRKSLGYRPYSQTQQSLNAH